MVIAWAKRSLAAPLLVWMSLLAVGNSPAQNSARHPVPEVDELKQAKRLLQEVYGKAYQDARTPEAKTALARRILDQAAESKGDPVSRFALLDTAQKIAEQAGDFETALETASRLGSAFEVDTMTRKADALEKSAQAAAGDPARIALAEKAVELMNAAIAQNAIEEACRLRDVAISTARRTRLAQFIKKTVAATEHLADHEKRYAAYRAALEQLAKDPTDAEANLAAGRYLCLMHGDWTRGVAMLALGSDAALKTLAAREIEASESTQAQVEVGDGWWDWAIRQQGRDKDSAMLRAGAWYRAAEPNVESAMVRVKLQERLRLVEKIGRPLPDAVAAAEISPRSPATPSGPSGREHSLPGASRESSLFDGTTLDGWVTRAGQPVRSGWIVEDGAIFRKERGGNILSAREYGDFDLRFEWKIARGGNSGIKYRVARYGNQLLGCEYQLLDDENNRGNSRDPKRSAGALYGLYAPNDQRSLRPAGQYNQARIVVQGKRIEHWMNGKKILEADTSSEEWRRRVARSKFSDKPGFGQNRMGRIMLTDHGHPVWLRNLRMVELSPPQVAVLPAPPGPAGTPVTPAPEPPIASPRRSVVLPDSVKLVRLAKLSHPRVDDCDPWISFDGRTLYWCRYDYDAKEYADPLNDPAALGLFVASRTGPDGDFGPPERLFPEGLRHPTVTADGRTLVCLARPSPDKARNPERVCIATRSTPGSRFGDVMQLADVERLCPHPYYKFPHFNEEGTTLSFARFTARHLSSLRWPDPAKPFRGARFEDVIGLDFSVKGNYPWPMLLEGGRALVCCHEDRLTATPPGGGLMLWRRRSGSDTFKHGAYLTLPGGKGLPCRCPRYCAATRELFFTSKNVEDLRAFHESTWDLWVLRGFDPSRIPAYD